ncbi:MAG: S8 family serine peptidase [Candidatus Zixiibacteriota bacterium]
MRIFSSKFSFKLKALWLFPFVLFVFLPHSLAQEKVVLKYPVNVPKIEERTAKFLDALSPDSVSTFWIYFTDKEIETHSNYKKAIGKLASQLTPRSLERRRLRGKKELFDFTDLPVSAKYVNEIETRCRRVRVVSRWLNAASVEATRTEIERISELPFVRSIGKVVTYYRRRPSKEDTKTFYRPSESLRRPGLLDYGPSFPQLSQIHVPALHGLGYHGEGVLVCMLDTGYKKDHPAFQKAFEEGRILAEYDFIHQDSDTQNDTLDVSNQHNHGTSTWSTLGGEWDGSLYGPAYKASFILAKTEMVWQEIEAEEDLWVAGIEWADSLGADVVSSSLGYNDWYMYKHMDGNTAVTTRAADLAVSKGIVVVNSAGNERDDIWYHIIAPADGDSVIAAGAVDEMGVIASFSSAGPTYDGRIKPDVCARGVNTYCAIPDEIFGYKRGTSLSAPLVAGVCALLLQIHPDWSPGVLRDSLWHTASRADNPDNLYGYGIVNAIKASKIPNPLFSSYDFNFFSHYRQGDPDPQFLEIISTTEEPLSWKATPEASWLTITPDSSKTPSTCTLSVNTLCLEDGVHNTSIEIVAENEVKSTQMIDVTLVISGMGNVLIYPNPFKDNLTIRVKKSKTDSRVKLHIFNLTGELVHEFFEEYEQPIFLTTWDGRNQKGEEVASGIYLIKLSSADETEIHKVAKIKE